MEKGLTIVGAGLAGLLASNMLARRPHEVLEAQSELPNNHSAVLRFRSSVVGDTLGIPFKRVQLIKATVPWSNPVADALAYSFKNTGVRRSDRSITHKTESDERFIAPPNLIARMAEGRIIKYGTSASFDDDGPYISTIPMPALMKLLDYPGREKLLFSSRPGVNIHAKIAACDAYVSLVVPNPENPISRISVTGDDLIIECSGAIEATESALRDAADWLGLDPGCIQGVTIHSSQYAKILPINEDERKAFMFWATDRYNVYSLGRFATWRPGLLLDDLVQDIRKIDGWLDRRHNVGWSR